MKNNFFYFVLFIILCVIYSCTHKVNVQNLESDCGFEYHENNILMLSEADDTINFIYVNTNRISPSLIDSIDTIIDESLAEILPNHVTLFHYSDPSDTILVKKGDVLIFEKLAVTTIDSFGVINTSKDLIGTSDFIHKLYVNKRIIIDPNE